MVSSCSKCIAELARWSPIEQPKEVLESTKCFVEVPINISLSTPTSRDIYANLCVMLSKGFVGIF